MDREEIRDKLNKLIVKASELKAEVNKLIHAIYLLKQEINNGIQKNNKKL
jgi:hypothetical protein